MIETREQWEYFKHLSRQDPSDVISPDVVKTIEALREVARAYQVEDFERLENAMADIQRRAPWLLGE